MKFFMSSEVQSDVSKDFQVAQKEVEKKIKLLESKDYGDSVIEISIIPIVVDLTPELEEAGFFKERIKYSKKSKETDIRLRINHASFKQADKETQKLMVISNVIQSIQALHSKVKSGFDVNSLEKDILELFEIDKTDFYKFS